MTIYSCDNSVDVASIILAGGQGTRLFPLTQTRCKPDVLFGGRYRLIDIPISASINSNINNIFVISQYLASHLNKHIKDTYSLGVYNKTSIDLLTPEEHSDIRTWYEGTADAVRKNLEHILDTPAQYYLILSGDHLYSMDLRKLLRFAISKEADLTVATIPMRRQDAKRMGVMKVDDDMYIERFYEKPQDEALLDELAVSSECASGCYKSFDQECYLGSMGIYVFKREVLVNMLSKIKEHDFGQHIIPHLVNSDAKTAAYVYKGYWEDIGTIESYFRSTMELLNREIGLNFYSEQNPIYAETVTLPSPLIDQCHITKSIISDGSIIRAKEISTSVIGFRTIIEKNTTLHNSIVMGSAHYHKEDNTLIPTIGSNCYLDGVIVDENAQIGNNVTLCNTLNIDHWDSDEMVIRDGIIIVKAGAKISDGTTLDSIAA